MRRARIKAVANLPIRRKATQDSTAPSTPRSTNPSSPVEKDSDEGDQGTIENAIHPSDLDKSSLRTAIEISPTSQISNTSTVGSEPLKQNSDIHNESNENISITGEEKIYDNEPEELEFKHDDCKKQKNSQECLTEQTAINFETKSSNPKEQDQDGNETVTTNSSEKLSCDKTKIDKKLTSKSTIASIIGRRRFKPTVKLAGSRGAAKDKVQSSGPEQESATTQKNNLDTVNNSNNKSSKKSPEITKFESTIQNGDATSFNFEEPPQVLSLTQKNSFTNSDLEKRQSISRHLFSSQSDRSIDSSMSSIMNPSQEIDPLQGSLKSESSISTFNLGLSEISVLNEKESDGPVRSQEKNNSSGSLNKVTSSNNIFNLELSQISALNEISQKDEATGSNNSQNQIIVQTTNKARNTASENSQSQTFATMRSPDNAFAGLRSPPYRAEPFKSDSYSLKSPVSPSKLLQNRSRFVRPVPRLDGGGRIRRNSVQGSGASASESEDDSRRSNSTVPNRIRNDSVCSVQSNRESMVNVGLNNLSASKQGQKRRMVVSESARKLAEARREFLIKHGNKVPDRNKLTMYDLIYYNPVTNPMKSQNESAPASRRNSICSSVGSITQEEENVDEPKAMPVPQVKVGPDGQLIIDEQSLIIEQTGTQKNREALANSEAVIDEGGTGNGFYKRRPKSKEWPKWETLRFYKALNTIGTDFLLMQSLFPKRTRQEIKLKFKKEERTNRQLVEKALTYHQEFDIEALENELAAFEERERNELEAKEREKEMKKQSKMKDKERTKTGKRKASRLVASSIDEDTEEEEVAPIGEIIPSTEEPVKSESNNNLCKQKPKKRIKRKRNISIEEALNDLMRGASSFVNNSDSDTEIYQRKPTRSGRAPKVRKLQAPEVNKLDGTLVFPDKSVEKETNSDSEDSRLGLEELKEVMEAPPEVTVEAPEDIQTAIPDMSHVEPGSLVILSSESLEEPGKTVLQVYMVSPNTDPSDPNGKQNMTPIDLSPELLATVTTKISQVEPINLEAEQAVNIV